MASRFVIHVAVNVIHSTTEMLIPAIQLTYPPLHAESDLERINDAEGVLSTTGAGTSTRWKRHRSAQR